MVLISKYEGPYFIVLNFEGYVKYIERWFYNQKKKGGIPANLISLFLESHKIHGRVQPFYGLHSNVFTELRFTIGVEHPYLRRFADKLRSVLL